MIKHIATDADGRITGIYDPVIYPRPDLPAIDIPAEAMSAIQDYKIVDGAVVHDPLPTPEPAPTPEERIAALEAANAELREAIEALLGGAT